MDKGVNWTVGQSDPNYKLNLSTLTFEGLHLHGLALIEKLNSEMNPLVGTMRLLEFVIRRSFDYYMTGAATVYGERDALYLKRPVEQLGQADEYSTDDEQAEPITPYTHRTLNVSGASLLYSEYGYVSLKQGWINTDKLNGQEYLMLRQIFNIPDAVEQLANTVIFIKARIASWTERGVLGGYVGNTTLSYPVMLKWVFNAIIYMPPISKQAQLIYNKMGRFSLGNPFHLLITLRILSSGDKRLRGNKPSRMRERLYRKLNNEPNHEMSFLVTEDDVLLCGESLTVWTGLNCWKR